MADFSPSSCLHVGTFPIFFFPWDRLKVPGSFYFFFLGYLTPCVGGRNRRLPGKCKRPGPAPGAAPAAKRRAREGKQLAGSVFREKPALPHRHLRFSNSDFPVAAPRSRPKQAEPRDKKTSAPRGGPPLLSRTHPDSRFRGGAGPGRGARGGGGLQGHTAPGGELQAKRRDFQVGGLGSKT